MGQIFHACAYDIDTKTCCVYDADKFHANCYSICGTVFSMHYLLRQKPYRIMWGGVYVFFDENLEKFSRTEDLLGFSTFWKSLEMNVNSDEMKSKPHYDKIKFIDENSKLWTYIYVWDEAKEYFEWEKTHSVKYSGYLLNHTKKQAVDLADFHKQSKYISKSGSEMAIDLIPVLTETGEGTQMAVFDGVSAESTEYLAGQWCGDLLQIVDELPKDYQLINCCIAEIWSKAQYCYHTFGVNEEGLLLNGNNGNLFEFAKLNLFGKRIQTAYLKVERTEEGKLYFCEYKKEL